MITTPEEWASVGGSGPRFALYSAIGIARGFASGTERCLATIHPALPHVGALGDWVGGDAPRLEAEAWLVSRRCTTLRGPMELCSFFPYRANLGPHEDPVFFTEPTEPGERWLAAGYTPAAHFKTEKADTNAMIAHGTQAGAALEAQGWRLEPWASGSGVSPEAFRDGVTLVHRLSAAAFSEAYGYAPIPESALQALYAPLRPLVDPRLVLFARSPQGEIGGFFFGLPDPTMPGRYLAKTLAVDPAYRRNGLGAWLTGALHQAAQAAGYTVGLHALMADTSHSTAISRHGATPIRRYALFEKHP